MRKKIEIIRYSTPCSGCLTRRKPVSHEQRRRKFPIKDMASLSVSILMARQGFRNRAGSQCCPSIGFGRSRSDGAGDRKDTRPQ